jgi:hypothetical protein
MLPTLFALMLAVNGASDAGTLPNVDEVVAKMIQRDAERRSALEGYTASGATCSKTRNITSKLPCSPG